MILERPKEFYSISLLSLKSIERFWNLNRYLHKIKQLGGPIQTTGRVVKSGQRTD